MTLVEFLRIKLTNGEISQIIEISKQKNLYFLKSQTFLLTPLKEILHNFNGLKVNFF